MTSSRSLRRPTGTGPEWSAPANEAHRILGERIAAGVDTWTDNALAARFHALAAPGLRQLLNRLDDLRTVTIGWKVDVENQLAEEGHVLTMRPSQEGSRNLATGLPLVDWECSCGADDFYCLYEAEARAAWDAHVRA